MARYRFALRIHRSSPILWAAFVAVCLVLAGHAHATRIKDIATFKGVRKNQLVGYGLVVGLTGTGDKGGSSLVEEPLSNMLEKLGVQVEGFGTGSGNGPNSLNRKLKTKNTAAVIITADMPVSARPGSKLDVTVSSLGDAKSLHGGVLLMTPLKGADGEIYALAQGPLTIGGFSIDGAAASVRENTPTVGIIPGGGTVERSIPFAFNNMPNVTLHMSIADFSTTQQVVDSINRALSGNYAFARDVATIDVAIPERFKGNLVPLMASLENLPVRPDAPAKVVVDEKTGTVVVGSGVRLAKVAVSHGDLQIVVAESANVSQPPAFSGGQTVTIPETDVEVREENNRLVLMEGATIQELVDGLNAIGATPRDLISILRTIKSAGALMAELEVI